MAATIDAMVAQAESDRRRREAPRGDHNRFWALYKKQRTAKRQAHARLVSHPRPIRQNAVIAIFDVRDSAGHLEPVTAENMSTYLAIRFAERGHSVIPRKDVREQLIAVKAESFRPCFDEACQIEVGKALAADHSISTELMVMGGKCVLGGFLYDLKTETTAAASAVAVEDCSESELLTALDELVEKIGAGKAPKSSVATVAGVAKRKSRPKRPNRKPITRPVIPKD